MKSFKIFMDKSDYKLNKGVNMEKGTKIKIAIAIVLIIGIVGMFIYMDIDSFNYKQKMVEEKAFERASIEEIKKWQNAEQHLEVLKYNGFYYNDDSNVKEDEDDSLKKIIFNLKFEEVNDFKGCLSDYIVSLYDCRLYISTKNKIITKEASWHETGFLMEEYNASCTRYYKIPDEDFLLLENALNELFL